MSCFLMLGQQISVSLSEVPAFTFLKYGDSLLLLKLLRREISTYRQATSFTPLAKQLFDAIFAHTHDRTRASRKKAP